MITPRVKFTALLLISIAVKLFCSHIGLFWDNVLFVSKMGTWLYENGLFNWHFPESFDPGHPPFIAFINAVAWKLFGRSLLVSHLVMVPFMIGFTWQLDLFISRFISPLRKKWFALIILLADPTLLAQFVLISPELIHLFFVFLAINAILDKKATLKIIALAMLGIVSFRGMMLCAGLFIFDIWQLLATQNSNSNRLKFLLSYLLASIPAVGFLAFRYLSVGWLFTHPNSPFAETSALVGVGGLFRNMAVMGHRFLDFGRLFIWIGLIIGFFRFKEIRMNGDVKTLLRIGISISAIIIITSLAIANPMGHRYFIGSYLAVASILCLLISKTNRWRMLYSLLLFLLVTGNLWVYPQKVAQGWDASLACIPYFSERSEMISYMDENRIPIEQTATFFPNVNPIDYINLNNDKRSFINFSGSEPYLLYSNVYNISDCDIEHINTNYTEIKRQTKGTINIVLYQHKKEN